MIIIFIIVAVALIFFLDFIIKSKRGKFWIGLLLSVIAIAGIIYKNNQEINNRATLNGQINTLKTANISLDSKIDLYSDLFKSMDNELYSIRHSYDSLSKVYNLLVKETSDIGSKTISKLNHTNLRIDQIGRSKGVRQISDLQKKIMISILSQFPNTHISVDFVLGDNETANFAREIGNIFLESGWKLKDNAVTGHLYIGGHIYKGINITAIINDPEYEKVSVLKQAFSTACIKIRYKENKDQNYKAPFQIIVGVIE